MKKNIKIKLINELRLFDKLLLLLSIGFAWMFNGYAIKESLFLNYSRLEFNKGIITEAIEHCRGNSSMLSDAQQFAELASDRKQNSTEYYLLGQIHHWQGNKKDGSSWQKTKYPCLTSFNKHKVTTHNNIISVLMITTM